MKKKKWLIVVNKWTYLWLLTIPAGILKIIFDYQASMAIATPNLPQFVFDTFVSILIMLIGMVLFIKMNTYSNWSNPNHPKS